MHEGLQHGSHQVGFVYHTANHRLNTITLMAKHFQGPNGRSPLQAVGLDSALCTRNCAKITLHGYVHTEQNICAAVEHVQQYRGRGTPG